MLRSYKSFVYLHGEDDLIIGTMSGPGAAVMTDWDQSVSCLSLSATSDAELGRVVREAWLRGRNIPLPNYKDGISKHMALRDVKTTRRLYKDAKMIAPMVLQGEVIIGASKQYDVGCYEPVPGAEITLIESSPDQAIGQAVRQALIWSS